VLATGFSVQQYFAPLQLIGRGGVNVLENWQKDRPNTYLGISAAGAPNYFFIGGPGTVSNICRVERIDIQTDKGTLLFSDIGA
jgi:cation diffusion facilitator CzcD-associated flavoprotein CzcO